MYSIYSRYYQVYDLQKPIYTRIDDMKTTFHALKPLDLFTLGSNQVYVKTSDTTFRAHGSDNERIWDYNKPCYTVEFETVSVSELEFGNRVIVDGLMVTYYAARDLDPNVLHARIL
jgi:hypothetical protein